MNYIQLILFKDALSKTTNLSHKNLAQLFNLSSRHITRKLKDLEELGVIRYKVGLGRGNTSEIEFLIDIEEEFLKYFLTNISYFTPEELNEILELPLSSTTISIIRSSIHKELYEKNTKKKTVYIDYLHRIPNFDNEMSIKDVSLQTITNNVGLRLFEKKGAGYSSYLLKYYECNDQKCYMYLQKNVMFSNGSILVANDVVDCLNKYLKRKLSGAYKNFIKSVTVDGKFSFHFTYKGDFKIVQHILSDLGATIYKEFEGYRLSIGPYQVSEVNDNYVTLVKNKYFHQYSFDIDEVYLINNLEKYIENVNSLKKIDDPNHFNYHFLYKNPNITVDSKKAKKLLKDIKDYYLNNDAIQDEEAIQLSITFIDDIPSHIQSLLIYLKSKNYNIEMHILNINDFINISVDDIHTDYIYFSELLLRDTYIFDLFTNSFLSKWCDTSYISETIVKKFFEQSHDNWKSFNDVIKKEREEKGNLILLTQEENKLIIPQNYDITEEFEYGIKNFSKLIKIR